MKKRTPPQSHESMQSVKTADAPFRDSDIGKQIDENKLEVLWAASTEALTTVGEGFETVVESIYEMIEDNQKTRQSNKKTRKVVYLGTLAMLLFAVSTLFSMHIMVKQASHQVQNTVGEQISVLKEVHEQANMLREETKLLSRMQASSIDVQVATKEALDEEASEEDKKDAERRGLEAQLELAKGRIELADTPKQKTEAKAAAKKTVAKARKADVGPVAIPEGL